jgi:hypothetical protein
MCGKLMVYHIYICGHIAIYISLWTNYISICILYERVWINNDNYKIYIYYSILSLLLSQNWDNQILTALWLLVKIIFAKVSQEPLFSAASASRSPREPILTPGNHRCYGDVGMWTDLKHGKPMENHPTSSMLYWILLFIPQLIGNFQLAMFGY